MRVQRIQVKQRQEINGFELAVERGRTTDFRPEGQVGAQELVGFGLFGGQLVERAIVFIQRPCAPLRLRQMFSAEVGIRGRRHRRVLAM